MRSVARARRAISNQMVDEGLKADGRGRWRVLAVTAWRGPASKREGLVTWVGPYAPSWEPRKALTADLREGGRIRAAKRTSAAEVNEGEDVQEATAADGVRRVSPRLQGDVPLEGLA